MFSSFQSMDGASRRGMQVERSKCKTHMEI